MLRARGLFHHDLDPQQCVAFTDHIAHPQHMHAPRTPPALLTPSGPRARVKGKLYTAIELIVFEGLPMDEAAHKVGLTTFQVRQAFSRTHVINHLKKRREVFRASVCGANVHRLAEIRDAANNIPAVQAIGMLERMDLEPAATRATQATPGLVIVVQGGVKQLEPPQRTLDVRTVENVNVPND